MSKLFEFIILPMKTQKGRTGFRSGNYELTQGMFGACFDFCSTSSVREDKLRQKNLADSENLKYDKNDNLYFSIMLSAKLSQGYSPY